MRAVIMCRPIFAAALFALAALSAGEATSAEGITLNHEHIGRVLAARRPNPVLDDLAVPGPSAPGRRLPGAPTAVPGGPTAKQFATHKPNTWQPGGNTPNGVYVVKKLAGRPK